MTDGPTDRHGKGVEPRIRNLKISFHPTLMLSPPPLLTYSGLYMRNNLGERYGLRLHLWTPGRGASTWIWTRWETQMLPRRRILSRWSTIPPRDRRKIRFHAYSRPKWVISIFSHYFFLNDNKAGYTTINYKRPERKKKILTWSLQTKSTD